jgi:predicted XRE-type DNA-binding protein
MKKTRKNQDELEDTRVQVGSGSIYADLGMKNFEEMETKANLVIEISKAIKKKRLTQTKAAKVLHISQPKLSDLLRGHFRGYSVERLLRFLLALGHDVEIKIKKPKNRNHQPRIYVNVGEGERRAPLVAKSSRR